MVGMGTVPSQSMMFMRMFISSSLRMKVSRCVISFAPSSVSCRQQQHHQHKRPFIDLKQW
jgi:hypothetical protein